ncbi:Crp/Fnr family transcriptional regulator [Salipiger mangrovisoli]|uniref:Crp/Fnr family transcriptional regulator n=1 Tax=Salipiger mangrovisoli TaxID=2865933 RepID=A0ABR9X5C6_9RHOB|nr:Crp/Fnr family transcriptional regulator [Salipiger mangrovisoli]MBE9638800.1 Crp/Fnr family transcriptional regulator [Salipiger mangrovisoli]
MQTTKTEAHSDGTRCLHCAVRASGFCSCLDPRSRSEISEKSTLSIYSKDTEIVTQGESFGKVGIIANGTVKLSTVTVDGDEHVLQVLRSGQLICLPENAKSQFSWTTVSEVRVCWMPHRAWDGFLQESPQHVQSYMTAMYSQFEQMQLWVTHMRGRHTLQRAAFWILEELSFTHRGDENTLHICLSRRDLASLLDMTVETLCRSLRLLHDKKAILLLTPDLLEVTDLAKLRLIARCLDGYVEDTSASFASERMARNWGGVSLSTRQNIDDTCAPSQDLIRGSEQTT